MKIRVWALALAGVGILTVPALQAQPARQADFIVAVVNSEPITNSEVRTQVQRIAAQITQSGQKAPPADTLQRDVLERLISDRAQLQWARETGIRIDDAAVDAAEQSVAAQNQVDVAEMRKRMATEGVDAASFRSQLRDQLALTRLHERDVQSRIKVSDQEIDRAMLERQSAVDCGAREGFGRAGGHVVPAGPKNTGPHPCRRRLHAPGTGSIGR